MDDLDLENALAVNLSDYSDLIDKMIEIAKERDYSLQEMVNVTLLFTFRVYLDLASERIEGVEDTEDMAARMFDPEKFCLLMEALNQNMALVLNQFTDANRVPDKESIN